MSDKTTYYQKNKEKLSIELKNFMKIAKKDCENKQKISRENYLMKKKT